MLNFCSLYSGSSGNSLFVETENTKILIDAGMSCKKIEEALQSIEVNPSSIDAILVTHEHSDHVKGISTISRKFDIPVFSTRETFDAMPAQTEKLSEKNINFFNLSEKFYINDLEILPFSIPHDAANPCGFNIIKDNKHQISIATDIGHMTKSIVNHLEGSEFVLLESNYDTEVLRCCSYPYKLKSRIAGDTGHLSNAMAGKTISYLANHGLNKVMLGHLSKENNFPELAYKTVVENLMENNLSENSLRLSVADRYKASPIIDVS